MTIVDKQSIRVPIILSIALIVFSMGVYTFFAYFREAEFYAYLQTTSINYSRLLFDGNVTPEQLKTIEADYSETPYIQRQYIIYDSTGTLLYKSKYAIPHLNQAYLKRVLEKNNNITFKKDGFERIIFANRENLHNKLYIFEAAGYDLQGFEKQQKLLYVLLAGCFMLIVFIIIISRHYIRRDLRPIATIAKRMQKISSKNLQNRIPEANLDNEIGQMAHTFNDLLDRLEASYAQQRNFVSYVTHELRTPLSILLGNTQVTLLKDRTVAEYKETLQGFQIDTNSMINLVNSLLELARMNADAQSVPFSEVRIDDILYQASESLSQKRNDYKINIEFQDIPENDEAVIVNGNAELLLLAFRNLMENACKYSENHRVDVRISFEKQSIILDFIDTGLGIPNEDLLHIFEAFYRTDKTKKMVGHGIGLPLTKRIVEIHSGIISVDSKVGEGSVFTVEIPSLELN